jgi:hypothetical protein
VFTDPHHLDAIPDPAFHCYPDLYKERTYFNADPDPTFHFDAYPDSDPAPFFLPIRIRILIKVMRIWNTGLQTNHGSRMSLHCSTAHRDFLGSIGSLHGSIGTHHGSIESLSGSIVSRTTALGFSL